MQNMMRGVSCSRLLLVACIATMMATTLLPSANAAVPSCQDLCWGDYTAEIEDCVTKADVSGLLQPVTSLALDSQQTDVTGTGAEYTGPTVDVGIKVREKCKENIGTQKLNKCLYKCTAPPPPPDTCERKCQKDYDYEVEDCVSRADVTGLLEAPPIGQSGLSEVSAPAPAPVYSGPTVNVLQEVEKQCKDNIGTYKLDTCKAACKPPKGCKEFIQECKDKYGDGTVGWLRCIKEKCGSAESGRRLFYHSR
jgi:hypothetical protein